MHGSRLSSAQWAPQVPLLRDEVDLTLVDLPGHGRRAEEEFTLARCVEVIDEAVRAVPDGTPVVLVGHSLGGYAAMAYAAAHPDALAGLVLAGASATPTGPGAALYRGVAALTDRLGPERMTRINDRVLRRLYPAERIDPVIAGGYYFDQTPAAWREVMTALPAVDAARGALPRAAAQRAVRPVPRRCPGLPARLSRRPCRDRQAGEPLRQPRPAARPSPRRSCASRSGSSIRRLGPDRGQSGA